MSGTEKGNISVSSLVKKYLNGTCSNMEAQEIVDFFEDPQNDNVFKVEAGSHWNTLDSNYNNDHVTIENKLRMDRILNRLHHRIRLHEEEVSGKHSAKTRVLSFFSKVAAVLILPLIVYSIYLTSRITTNITAEAKKIAWQTVKTKVGMQTDFLLPDGSHVWLNSGSVIKYPATFAKDMRQVELTGEAFFDIVKNESHPFLVNAGKMNVEVKGTRFDMINYPCEMLTELILESGSVRLFSGNFEDHNTIALIKPGERAVLNVKENKLTVRKVNVDQYTAWKEGMLVFRDDHMDEVVRKLSRWFNVEVILQSPELAGYVYTATYRDETLAQILELLIISAPIKFSIIERERLGDNTFSKRKIILTKRK